jgi:DNA-binding Lrp family transcriptional regulator
LRAEWASRWHTLAGQLIEIEKGNRALRSKLKAGRPIVDEADREILRVVLEDGRRSAREVGRLVGLSPPAAKRRIDRLEHEGFILGYTAVLDRDRLEESITAFIELRFGPGTQVGDIDTAVVDLPEVVESFTLAGDPDALVRVRVQDLEHLKSVVDRIRRGRRGGPRVLTTRTSIVLGQRRAPARA